MGLPFNEDCELVDKLPFNERCEWGAVLICDIATSTYQNQQL
jgi:hypothetical protein